MKSKWNKLEKIKNCDKSCFSAIAVKICVK